jgi:nucleotide-binding universal stress UspA family protein
MPQIIVAADRGAAFGEGAVTLRETVSVADFESRHFAAQLVERLGWAVEDANRVEEDSPSAEERANGVEEDSPSAEERANRFGNNSPTAQERAKPRSPQHIPDQRRARRISEEPQSQREERVTVQSPA